MTQRRSKRARALGEDERLTAEQTGRLREWADEHTPRMAARFEIEIEKWLDYHKAHGTLIMDIMASARKWFRNGEEWQAEKSRVAGTGLRPLPLFDPDDQDDVEARVRRELNDPELRREREKAIEEARKRKWRGTKVIRDGRLT